ncbi:MAG: AAA family ATPase [Planctomycetota bacterium]
MTKSKNKKKDGGTRSGKGVKRPDGDALGTFVARDLTEAARVGRLRPGRRLGNRVERLRALLVAGRSPVVVGGSGVGKTCLVESLACDLAERPLRAPGLPKPLPLRVVEVSLRGLCQRAKSRAQVSEQFRRLTAALVEAKDAIPYFRDFHVAWDLDLECFLDDLFLRIARPVLAEGDQGPIECMLEHMPSVESLVSIVRLEEPSVAEARALAIDWASGRATGGGRWQDVVTEDALDAAADIAGRFHVRDRLPRTLFGPLTELVERSRGAAVDAEDVVAHAVETWGLPRSLVDPRARVDLDALTARLSAEVVGQPEAVTALVDAVGLFKAGLSDPDRPLGVHLFTGPTGVGKTQLVRALARELLGSDETLLRINMSDHREADAAETLFGAPYAMSAGQRQATLTRTLTGRGFGVLLLDEFEKAHPAVHDRFMQLFDEGKFVNGAGQVISCRSFLLVATSNAGADAWVREALGFPDAPDDERVRAAVDRALARVFRAELLNRFDRVLAFPPLTRASVREIARREVVGLAKRAGCAQRGLVVDVDDEVIDWIGDLGYDVERGARPLKRAVEQRIATAVARALTGTGMDSAVNSTAVSARHPDVGLGTGLRGGQLRIRRGGTGVTVETSRA